MQFSDTSASNNYLDLFSAFTLLIVHFVFIALLAIQAKSGSKFFLPDSMRTEVYEEMIRKVETSSSENTLCCQLCTNLLSQPELEYSYNYLEYKKIHFPLGYYIQTHCQHKFHLNCILKSVDKCKVCPVCYINLDISGYED